MLLVNIEKIKEDPVLRQFIRDGYVKYTTYKSKGVVIPMFEFMVAHSRRGCSCQLARYRKLHNLQKHSMVSALGKTLKCNLPSYCKCRPLKNEPKHVEAKTHWWFIGVESIKVDDYFSGEATIKWASVAPHSSFSTVNADYSVLVIPEIKAEREYFSDNDRSADKTISTIKKNKKYLDGVFNG